MTEGSARPERWSFGRWWKAVAFAVLVQVFLVWVLSDRQSAVPQTPAHPRGLWLADATGPGATAGSGMCLPDPTLFALPSAQGFSGSAWRISASLAYQSPDWTEPIRWLALTRTNLGRAFLRSPGPPRAPGQWANEKPAPRTPRLNLSNVPVQPTSQLVLSRALEARGVLALPELPSLVHSNLVSDTVVEMAVDPSGFPFSTVLWRSCGWRAADLQALELARSVRFTPRPQSTGAESDGVVWGRLTFRWRPLPPAAEDGGGEKEPAR